MVTGCRTGIGASPTHALAEAGAHVVIAARDIEGCRATAADIVAAGGKAIALALDITDRKQIEALVTDVGKQFGLIDILVNNAGVCYHRPALEVPDDEWHKVFDVNVHGLWYCSRIIGRTTVERRSGNIINIGSMSAEIVYRPQF